MARYHVNQSCKLPDYHNRFEEVEKYIVGYYFGSSFHVSCTTDNYELAVSRMVDLQLRTSRDCVVIKQRIQLFLDCEIEKEF